MKQISNIIEENKKIERPKNNTTEFQMYGVYLAEQLQDAKHYSLYIKLSKNTPRPILEEALAYTKNYTTAKSRARIFMWRLKQLKDGKKPQ
jgi:hypothetical protein